MSAYDAQCKNCGAQIWGVDKSADETIWYHWPPTDQARKHCKGQRRGGAVAEPEMASIAVK